ncbi:hypothetical protein BDW22DRAFT_265229 [Trametopsis cervina]|nr:hypothetical protein BDW22DRAFT_265229 [Trametopsis cervina]
MQAVHNTLQVIPCAFGKPDLLHRDISSDNIMLDENMQGFLNDWDRASEVSHMQEAKLYRTGTWQFMSVAVLQDPTKVHSIINDIESCFWVFFYMACHHFPIKQGHPNLARLFDEVSEEVGDDGKINYVGGDAKAGALRFDGITGTIVFKSPPLTQAINDFAALLGLYYHRREATGLFPNDRTAQERLDTITTQLEKIEDILAIFDKALASEDWPKEDDAVEDQFPVISSTELYWPRVDAHEGSFSAPREAGLPTVPFGLHNTDSDSDHTDVAGSIVALPPVLARVSRSRAPPRSSTCSSTRTRAARYPRAGSILADDQSPLVLVASDQKKKRPIHENNDDITQRRAKRGKKAVNALEETQHEHEHHVICATASNRRMTRAATKAASPAQAS